MAEKTPPKGEPAEDPPKDPAKEPPKTDPPKPTEQDPPKSDDLDPKLAAAVTKLVESILGKAEPGKADTRTRKDIEAEARAEAERAVREVTDAEDLKRLRDAEATAKEAKTKEDKPKVPGRNRRLTRALWGGDDE